jgi:hypothetical protein
MYFRTLAIAACCTLLAPAGFAQNDNHMGDMKMEQSSDKALPSPPATAEVSLNGKQLTIHYNSPRLKGRTIGSDIVPYGKIWRTGANPATTLVTAANLKIGTLDAPAGTYTLFTLPSAAQWLLIVNKQTGQWGLEYHMDQDLGRTPMTSEPLANPQENMSISFEHTHGAHTELHVRWGNTDEYVPVTAQ